LRLKHPVCREISSQLSRIPLVEVAVNIIHKVKAMPIGTCKFWRADKGYGFLSVEGSRDAFIHISEIQRAGYAALAEGQKVKFELTISARTGRENAVAIELLEPIVSPRIGPTSFHAREMDGDAHHQLAETAFLKARR